MNFWNDLSLRIKLTFSFLGLLALILLVLGITLYLDNKNFLIKNLAIRVRAQAKPVISHWIFEDKGAPPLLGDDNRNAKNPELHKIASFLAQDLTSRDTGAIVLDRNGQILADGRILPEEPESAPPQPLYYKKTLAGEKEVEYETVFKGRHVLVVLIPLKPTPLSENILGAVQLTTPLAQIDHILFRQRMALMIGIGLAILVGAFLGLILTSSVLKGLTKMVATCKGIASGDLTQRVGLGGTRGDEIGQLSAAFDNMADKIQASFESQRRFVANAAHELRTPLTAIQGSVEVLMRGAQDDPETASRLIQGIYKETRRLSSLCEKLLSLSKLEVSANIEKRPFELEEFFSGLLPQIKASLKGQRLQLQRGGPVRLIADPDLFARVIINLIDNAIRHTPVDGEIALGWEKAASEILVWVSDNGHGILQEDLPHIFAPFYQGRHVLEDQTDTGRVLSTKDGAGIGLALVDVIVKAHGWKIEVDSVQGKGTRFTIRIPV